MMGGEMTADEYKICGIRLDIATVTLRQVVGEARMLTNAMGLEPHGINTAIMNQAQLGDPK